MPPNSLSPKLAIAAGAAPCLLAIVAVTQIATSIQTNLSPWKGGGFGMFSDIQQPSNRSVLAWVRVDGKVYPANIPDWLSRQKNAVLALPTKDRLSVLAEELAQLDWDPGSSKRPPAADGLSPTTAKGAGDAGENILVAAAFEVRYSAGSNPELREIHLEQLCRVVLKLDQGGRSQ